MAYADLTSEEQILLAAEFIGRGQDVPREIARGLGHEIMHDILAPESKHDGPQGSSDATHQ